MKYLHETIRDYVIVYETARDGYADVAEHLREKIQNATGQSLSVKADSECAETDKEILIGRTNRTFSSECYGAFEELLTCRMIAKDGRIQMVSGGPYSAQACADEFVDLFLSEEPKPFCDGCCFEKDLRADFSLNFEHTKGADLRVMSYNILCVRWSKTPLVTQRAEIVAAVLALYQPDVVGAQEVDEPWVAHLQGYCEILKKQYGVEYSMIMNTYENIPNFNAILYRSDKMTLESSDVDVVSWWKTDYDNKGYHLRNVTWAKFRMGEKQFILANTHWGSGIPQQVMIEAQEEADLINCLSEEHGVPIFCTGDFNSFFIDEHMKLFVSEAKLRHLFWEAMEAKVLVNENSGIGRVGEPRVKKADNYIDHVIGRGDYTVKKYETLLGEALKWVSDHSPHYADVALYSNHTLENK